MTNEEKAKQISNDYPMPPTFITNGDVRVMMENSALQMSEWKDKQIDTILFTAEGCLRSFLESQRNSQESINNFFSAIKMQIDINLSEL